MALGFRPLLKKMIIGFVKRLLEPSIHFHATSVPEARHIRQCFGEDVAVTVIQSRMELPVFIGPTLSPPSPPYLLFIGRLHPIKAIDD